MTQLSLQSPVWNTLTVHRNGSGCSVTRRSVLQLVLTLATILLIYSPRFWTLLPLLALGHWLCKSIFVNKIMCRAREGDGSYGQLWSQPIMGIGICSFNVCIVLRLPSTYYLVSSDRVCIFLQLHSIRIRSPNLSLDSDITIWVSLQCLWSKLPRHRGLPTTHLS